MARIAEILEAKGITVVLQQNKVNGISSPLPAPPLPTKYFSKVCKSCGDQKEIQHFAKNTRGAGRQDTCLECRSLKRVATMRENKAEQKRLESIFTCINCQQEKPIAERSARNHWCRPCQTTYQRKYQVRYAAAKRQAQAAQHVPVFPIDQPVSFWRRCLNWLRDV